MVLVLVICLAATPDVCERRDLVVSLEPAGPLACLLTGQQEIARWSAAHPLWRVTGWTCRPLGAGRAA